MRFLDRLESIAADRQLARAIEERREDLVSAAADRCRMREVICVPGACEEQRARFTQLDRVEIVYRSRYAPVIDDEPPAARCAEAVASVAFPIESKTTSTPTP
jgi:hypothetical protein